jgi:hypothetical protein
VKDYRVTYSNTGAYSQGDVFNTTTYEYNKNGSLITQVQECDAGNTCLTPAKFTWSIGTVLNGQTGLFQAEQNWLPAVNKPTTSKIDAIGDIDGDGLKDVLYETTSGGVGSYYYARATGSGFLPTGTPLMAFNSNINAMFLADVNGDGKADLLWGNQVRLSNGNGFDAASSWIDNSGAEIISTGDINGDGKADVLYQIIIAPTKFSTDKSTTSSWYFGLSTGTTFSAGVNIGSKVTTSSCPIVGGGSCTITILSSSGILGGMLGDFDGDGFADIIGNRNGQVYKSLGSSFDSGVVWLSGFKPLVQAVGDYDGNGTMDVLTPGPSMTNSIHLALSNSKSLIDSGEVYSGGTAANLILDDLNYDGVGDLVVGKLIKLAAATLPDLLVGIEQGLAATVNITQQKLSAVNGGVPLYVSDRGTSEASSYPTLDVLAISPQYVVSAVTVSDGNGGVLTNNYSYGGLKADLHGRGSLGFRYQKVTQADADINSTTFFRQDYPYIGLPSQIEKRVSSTNTLVNASVLSYANAPKTEGSAISQFPWLTQSVEQSFELSGNLINTTTKTNQYDGYGNATQIVVNSGDGYSKTTTNVYYNDTSNGNWLLGRLLRSTVTSTAP